MSNPEWVVGGKGASNVFDGNQISLMAAKKIAQGVPRLGGGEGRQHVALHHRQRRRARAHGADGRPGVQQHPHGADEGADLAPDAWPTSVYTAQGRNNPAGQNRTIAQYDFFTNSGGIPIVVDGQMIGAIGVGGGAGGGGDENCAIEGLKATFGEHVTLPVYPAPAAPTTAAR